MADTITVTYKVNEDGSLSKIANKAEGAAKATDKATKSSDNYSKKQKGVAGATSNGTKAFSKMTQGMTSGLVPAYAALAANVFAVSAAFNFLKRAADVKILEEGQKSYAASTGIALQSITANLREASGGMLGFREAAEAAAIGVAKGFSPKQLEDLAVGAKKAASALGRNFEDAFDRLIRGASKAEPELLDELGITLRLETASKRYADQIGKTVKQLNTFEKSQAVLLETQRQLEAQFGQMEGATNPFVKLSKTFEDLVKAGTNFLMPLFEGIANIVNRSAVAAIAVFGMFGLSILKVMFPMDELRERIAKIGTDSEASVQAAITDQQAYQAEIKRTTDVLNASKKQGVQSAAKSMGDSSSKLVQKAQKGELTDPKQIGALKAHLKKAETEYRIHNKVRSGVFKGASLEQIQNLKGALTTMGKDHLSFVQRRKLEYKSLTLTAKVHYAKVRAFGSRAFLGLTKVATLAGNAMNKAMKLAGFIGMAMMIFEVIKTLGTKIGSIMKSITKGLDFVINGFLGGVDYLLTEYGKTFDSVFNSIKSGINILIRAYNKLPGDDIKELSTNTTAAQDALGNLVGRVNLSADDSWLNTTAMNLQNFTINSIEAGASLDALKTKIETMGEDAKLAVKGNQDFVKGTMSSLKKSLADGTITLEEYEKSIKGMRARVEGNKATNISTLGISSIMEQIKATTNSGDRKKLQDQLDRLLPTLGEQHGGLVTAIKAGQISVVKDIEFVAQEATAGVASLKNSILDLSTAMGSGDLLQAELALDALASTSGSTSENFKKLFGKDSDAARAALEKYETAFTKAGTTTEEFRQNLKDLRAEQAKLAQSKLMETVLGGTLGDLLKANNAIASIAQTLTKLNLEKATATPKRLLEIEAEITLLNLQLKLAKAAKSTVAFQGTGTFGEGVGQAVKSGQSMQALDDESSMLDIAEQARQVAAPLAKSFADLGPDGQAIQAVMQGMMVMIDGATMLRDTLREITTEMGVKMPTSFEEFGEVWKGMDMQSKAKFLGASFGAMAGQLGALNSAMQAKAKQTVAAIDKEIAAEKKRDGQSAGSQAKILALEKKKESAKRKAFETDKKLKIAQTIMATAQGIMAAFGMGPILGPIFGAMVAATGAMQLSVIQGMTFDGGGGGAASAPTGVKIGNRQNSVDMATARSPSGELGYARGESGTGGGMTDYKPAFSGYKHRAGGGYVVGEQGPEVFMPETAGEIIPSGQSSGGTTNVNFSINAVDAAGVEDLLMTQRGNIIGMIRESANAHGEMFLEGVDIMSDSADMSR